MASIGLLIELVSSTALLYKYRFEQEDNSDFYGETSKLSTLNILQKAGARLGIFERRVTTLEYKKSVEPAPYLIADDYLGYRAPPGEYIQTYYRRKGPKSDWELLKLNVKINPDGSRWTGHSNQDSDSSIYILGDSQSFGHGVNNEQTFSYLLQQSMTDKQVKLFALGGYSMTHAYLNFDRIKNSIGPRDVIILGYLDQHDAWNVLSPEFFKTIHTGNNNTQNQGSPANQIRSRPKATLDEVGKITISYMPEGCLNNGNYCNGPEPSNEEMAIVTAALFNYVAKNTQAKVYILHLDGETTNPVFSNLDKNISLISALPEDFDYFIRDDVVGFDPHPGPYWHYGISRKLIEALGK